MKREALRNLLHTSVMTHLQERDVYVKHKIPEGHIFQCSIELGTYTYCIELRTYLKNYLLTTIPTFQTEKQCLAEESSARRSSRTDRTTRMLLAVLGLFLSTEVPQGLLGLASALAPDFFKSCYSMFG